jgi:hypothetical protein
MSSTLTPPEEAAPVYEDAYVFPLSHAQERLWYVEQLTPGLAAYNVPLAVRLTGRLDRAALAAALQGVVERHEALRTGFRTEAGQPVQVIAPAGEARVPLPRVDLATLAPEDREREVARLAAEEAGAAFDLRRSPLLRARLLALGSAEHVLLLTLHHIVSDRWSMGVLMSELAALYADAPLPALPLQYADYAVWQREWLQGEVLASQLAYWRERLADLPGLDLPVDRRRSIGAGGPSGAGGSDHPAGQVAMELPVDLAAALQALSREAGATLFMTLLAAFLVVLARVGGQDDLAVGTAVANRGRREIEGLIGFFVNTLVLRVSLAGEPSFRQLLARVRVVTLGAYDHQDLPFERLVEELRPARNAGNIGASGASGDTSRPPLVQVTFLLQNTPLPTLHLPGLALAEVPVETATAKFDLSVAMTEHGEGITGIWSYDARIFTAATIERLAGLYRRLLAAALADPEASVFALPLATEDEMARLLSDFTRPLV